ncbi:MAG: hypothetical protein J5849_06390 [Clostridia bacterium]|nr:hypothetical protein [Clostridia bacterium]
MAKKKKKKPASSPSPEMRVDPENRVAPLYDAAGILRAEPAPRGKMGVRVLDDEPEEHRM